MLRAAKAPFELPDEMMKLVYRQGLLWYQQRFYPTSDALRRCDAAADDRTRCSFNEDANDTWHSPEYSRRKEPASPDDSFKRTAKSPGNSFTAGTVIIAAVVAVVVVAAAVLVVVAVLTTA